MRTTKYRRQPSVEQHASRIYMDGANPNAALEQRFLEKTVEQLTERTAPERSTLQAALAVVQKLPKTTLSVCRRLSSPKQRSHLCSLSIFERSVYSLSERNDMPRHYYSHFIG